MSDRLRDEKGRLLPASQTVGQTPVDDSPKTFVFAAMQRQHQIANWIAEIKGRDSGEVIQREVPIRFEDNLVLTQDAAMAKYIRESKSLASGTCREFFDDPDTKSGQTAVAKARKWVLEVNASKQVRRLDSRIEEQTNVDLKQSAQSGMVEATEH